MCILSSHQGHSESCECDKHAPEATLTLPDALEQLALNSKEFEECLISFQNTIDTLRTVTSLLQDLKTQVSGGTGAEMGQYQVLSTEMFIEALGGRTEGFQYRLDLINQVPGRIWKNSRFQLEFTLTDSDGCAVSERFQFQLYVYKAVAPLTQINSGVHSKLFLRGQSVQNSNSALLRFQKLSFSEVSSNFPEKAVRLVVLCRDSEKVQPFVSIPLRVTSRF